MNDYEAILRMGVDQFNSTYGRTLKSQSDIFDLYAITKALQKEYTFSSVPCF